MSPERKAAKRRAADRRRRVRRMAMVRACAAMVAALAVVLHATIEAKSTWSRRGPGVIFVLRAVSGRVVARLGVGVVHV